MKRVMAAGKEQNLKATTEVTHATYMCPDLPVPTAQYAGEQKPKCSPAEAPHPTNKCPWVRLKISPDGHQVDS